MPRRKQNLSAATTVGGVLSFLLFIGVSVTVVILRAERRAARNQDTVQSDGYRGSGDPFEDHPGAFDPRTRRSGPPSDTPVQPQPQPDLNFPPTQSKPQMLLPKAAPELVPEPLLKPGVRETTPTG